MNSSINNNNPPSSKFLLLFDFDETISNETVTYRAMKSLLTEEEFQNIKKFSDNNNNWITAANEVLKLYKKKGITIAKLNSEFESVEMTPGMVKLFEYIKQKKNKYDLVLLSSSYEYLLKHMLKFYEIADLFNEIFCPISVIGKTNDDQLIFVKQRYTHNCKICNPSGCKTKDFNVFCENKNMNIYNKKIFICDGGNDFCLAKNLDKNDTVMIRKNFGLYKKLNNKEMKKELKCKIIEWSDGEEIVNYLENLK